MNVDRSPVDPGRGASRRLRLRHGQVRAVGRIQMISLFQSRNFSGDLRKSAGDEFVNRIERGLENSEERRRVKPGRRSGTASALIVIIGIARNCNCLSRARPSPAFVVSCPGCNRDRAPETRLCRMNSIAVSKANSVPEVAIQERTRLIGLAASIVRQVFIEQPHPVEASDDSAVAVSIPALGRLPVLPLHPDAVTALFLNTVGSGTVLRSSRRRFISRLRSLAGLRIADTALCSPTKVLAT